MCQSFLRKSTENHGMGQATTILYRLKKYAEASQQQYSSLEGAFVESNRSPQIPTDPNSLERSTSILFTTSAALLPTFFAIMSSPTLVHHEARYGKECEDQTSMKVAKDGWLLDKLPIEKFKSLQITSRSLKLPQVISSCFKEALNESGLVLRQPAPQQMPLSQRKCCFQLN